jgi:hypothetical protein
VDPGWLSRIRIFSISDPGPKRFPHPHQRNLSIFTQRIGSKLSEMWSRVFIPDPYPGSWYVSHPESGSATLDPLYPRRNSCHCWRYSSSVEIIKSPAINPRDMWIWMEV